ncbi:hypothetical protein VMCG_10119 [Cytospora schulzeri]|uniref:DUF1765-domain-containing protein n=1 Tax=Cytospora schulzeri TaxID=448051 RepID=A0A423VGB2_9PEZI|nr:hypothetical protein VMCG_10119 [Valsa malicola]
MNGPALTMAAPAVEPSQIHRSHSSPELFLDASSPLTKSSLAISSRIGSTASSPREDGSSRPGSSPQFEVPSFDFGTTDFETQLSIESRLPRVEVTPDDKDKPVKPEPNKLLKPMAVPKATIPKSTRSKSIVDRPRSWLPTKPIDGTEKPSVLRRAKKTEEREKEKEKEDRKDKDKEKENQKEKEKDAAGKSTTDDGPDPKFLTPKDRSSSFADFAKKSWISPSRSTSPSKSSDPPRKGPVVKGDNATGGSEPPKEKDASHLSPNKLTRRRPKAGSLGDEARSKSSDSLGSTSSRALNRASVYFGKIKHKPQQNPANANGHLEVPSLGQPTKTEAVSASPATSTGSTAENTPNPRLSSQTALSSNSETSSGGTGSTGITEPSQNSDTMAQKSHPSPDPQWATFRRLDSEYAIFLTKQTTAQRILIARNTLIPFLRNHGSHGNQATTNDTNLAPEDVDRRATILHKWWNGLLELLEGSAVRKSTGPAMSFTAIQASTPQTNLQPVAGVDRPGLLELITYIMMRPEWRMTTSSFRPLRSRSPREVVRGRADTKSSVDFVAESAEHNVRTMFVNNLLTQMGIVVERMSNRHAPVSMVTFCGKACAYAFFFVPGISEVLVRLWGLTPDLLRRVADEFGLPRRSKGESEDIVSLFPSTLHKLGWTSVKTMTDNLRLTTKLSLAAAKIRWHGPWVSRWRGGDTDLFFIFCKYYYILADDYMPIDLPLFEKARAPAYALIHAQLLSVLDTTIHHRQAAFENMMNPNILDVANGADAMAASLAQLPPSNLLRGMDENRLIVLLKDMLSETAVGGLEDGTRQTFATAFMCIMKAATKKTPVFRQAPVLVLVDFLQEVLLAFNTYAGYTESGHKGQQGGVDSPIDHVDWEFWLEVCHKILYESNSTMSEIRILSFIFSAWDILAAVPARKEKLCIGWLLSEEVFDKFFNNYTPMVRAYFMRLLCWRVCRDQGSPTELDMRIFLLVSERLKQAWSHYLWRKQQAEALGKMPPSTAPCHPQPGKRFMIIRMEMTPPQTGLLQGGFDTMNGTLGFVGPDYTVSAPSDVVAVSNAQGESTAKKRWSIFGKMLHFGSTTAPGSPNAANGRRDSSTGDDLDAARRATAAAASTSKPAPPPKAEASSGESDASSTGSSPVFDAAQFVFKFTLGSLPWHHATEAMGNAGGLLSTLPRERSLQRPRLPAPAQARVSAKLAWLDGRSDSPPPPAVERPPPERMYSGVSQRGLVSEARNAAPLETENDVTEKEDEKKDVKEDDKENDKENDTTESVPSLPPIQRVASIKSNVDKPAQDPPSDDSDHLYLQVHRARSEAERQVIQPVEPVGIFKERATYSGRALAEWGIVVNECNSFVERRRDEGVCGLKDVEVPSLGIENMRRHG